MATCSRCGNQVEFRYIGGKCVPIHSSGHCTGIVNDYSGYNTSPESTCFRTRCPKCGDNVFFIKHNGGSVWIDPPLGPPWYKHPCFEDQAIASRGSLVMEYKHVSEADYVLESSLSLGIVKSTLVEEELKRFTDITFETGPQETIHIRLKHNAGFLLGKLCIYNSRTDELWPIDEPSFVFIQFDPSILSEGFMKCPKCDAFIKQDNLNRHLRRVHNVKLSDGR